MHVYAMHIHIMHVYTQAHIYPLKSMAFKNYISGEMQASHSVQILERWRLYSAFIVQFSPLRVWLFRAEGVKITCTKRKRKHLSLITLSNGLSCTTVCLTFSRFLEISWEQNEM